MVKKIVAVFAMICVISFSLNSSANTGYRYVNGHIIRWYRPLVKVCLDQDSKEIPKLEIAVKRAVRTWNAVPYSPNMFYDGSFFDCQIYVTFGSIPDLWSFKPLAINTIKPNSDGSIERSDIIVNSYYRKLFGDASSQTWAYDLDSVVSHEIGHALGLEGEPNDVNSIMFEKFAPGFTVKRNATRADIDSIRLLYKGVQFKSEN